MERIEINPAVCSGKPVIRGTCIMVRNILGMVAGGYTTEHYGRPHVGLHTLQIEINRALYMDEDRMERTAGLKRVTTAISWKFTVYVVL